jgi:hypothetical protein
VFGTKALQIGTCAPAARQSQTHSALYADGVPIRANPNGNAELARAAASQAQCWRMNMLGLLQLRETPGEPIARENAKRLLNEAVKRGLWKPEAREGKR